MNQTKEQGNVKRMQYYHVHLRVTDAGSGTNDVKHCYLTYMGSGLAEGDGESLEYSDRISGVINIETVKMWPSVEVEYHPEEKGRPYKTKADFRVIGDNPLYMGGEIRALSPLSAREGLLGLSIPYDTKNTTFVVDMNGSGLSLPASPLAFVQNPDGEVETLGRPVLYSFDKAACFLSAGEVKGGSNLVFRWSEKTQNQSERPMSLKRGDVFFSYSHKDSKWLDHFEVMLHPLIRSGELSIWSDKKITAGAKWKEEINKALTKAKVAVLLVSPGFLRSDFIAQNELPPLLSAAMEGGLRIIWVPVSYCLWKHSPLANYQAAHNPEEPLDSLNESMVNEAIMNVCSKILEAFTS